MHCIQYGSYVTVNLLLRFNLAIDSMRWHFLSSYAFCGDASVVDLYSIHDHNLHVTRTSFGARLLHPLQPCGERIFDCLRAQSRCVSSLRQRDHAKSGPHDSGCLSGETAHLAPKNSTLQHSGRRLPLSSRNFNNLLGSSSTTTCSHADGGRRRSW
jgi:hypothetical protein